MNKVVLLYKNPTVGRENLSVGWVNDAKTMYNLTVKFDIDRKRILKACI